MGVEGTRFLEGHLVITPLGFVPIRLASSCASLIEFSPSFPVTVTLLLFASHPIGFRVCRGSGHIFHTHLRSPRPPFLPPPFFPMRIRTLRGTPVSFPIRPYPPASHPCADLYWYIQTALPLFHPSSNTFLSRSLSLFLSSPTHPYVTSRIISPSFGIHSPPPRSPVPQQSAPGDPPTT